MTTQTEYRKCPKCGLNYITGAERFCAVCVAAAKPYMGKRCRECGAKSGAYDLCYNCHKMRRLSVNERNAAAGYRTDNGMVGARTRSVCEICGTPSYGKLCGRCYMAVHYNEYVEETDN